jgi:hypothetical protein
MEHLTETQTRKIITEAGVAEIYGTSLATVRRMRQRGEGPEWFDLRNSCAGRPIIRYYEDMVHSWIESTKQKSNALRG